MKIRRNKENKLTQITGHFDGYHKTMVEYDIRAIKILDSKKTKRYFEQSYP